MHEASTGLTSGSVQQENSADGGLTHISRFDISYFAFNFASKLVDLYPLSSSFLSLDLITGMVAGGVPRLCLLSCWSKRDLLVRCSRGPPALRTQP